MKTIEDRLKSVKKHINEDNITIMIMGLGSVGNYLLDYLSSTENEKFNIVVVGRKFDKIESDVNIVKISSLIRKKCRSKFFIEANVDFNDVTAMEMCMKKYNPDFIVNTSRVYSGLKYGTISWNKLRAYGIWSPLAIKYIKNIMKAHEKSGVESIVINTSYSDAVIPWLKSAGRNYPDFGSGNINHLIPRIKYAVAEELGIKDFWNVKVMFATSHFHDVVISKEGHNEGMEQLIRCYYNDEEVKIDQNDVFKKCKIAMPTDAKRNMMNASSNYDIIMSIINALREEKETTFFSPGALGEIGGYPVIIDGKNCAAKIDDSVFSINDMRDANRKSISYDGIKNVENGILTYTDELLDKVKKSFSVDLTKNVRYEDIDNVANFIIKEIIEPEMDKRND